MSGSLSDFCILNGRQDGRLSDVERLTVVGGRGLDRVLERLAKNLASVSLSTITPFLDSQRLQQQAIRLHHLRGNGVIDGLFEAPRRFVKPAVTQIHGFPDGSVTDLRFSSQFPHNGWPHDPDYVATEENTTSYVRLWSHTVQQPSRLTVVAIHGWTMGDQRVNSLAFLPGVLYRLGFNVALVELPFHGRRRPIGLPDDVPLFPSVDPIRTCLSIAHALHDLRLLRDFLVTEGMDRIATIGMSLGAYVATVWASRDELDRALYAVPLVSMGGMATSLVETSSISGLSPEFLLDLYSDHFPLQSEPRTVQERMMVIGGQGDHLVPQAQIAELHTRWPRVPIKWASGGHSAPTNRQGAFLDVVQFLSRTSFD
jgi:hypothetical protein